MPHLLTTVSGLAACLPAVGVGVAIVRSFTVALILVPSMLGANRLGLACEACLAGTEPGVDGPCGGASTLGSAV